MTPAAIIQSATADGISLSVSASGAIKAGGDPPKIARWMPVIREHKAAIIAALRVGAGDTLAKTSHGWLIHYADRKPVECYICPLVTHAELMKLKPDALAAEALPDLPVIPDPPE
ncbi:MAG: hypothetical protein IPO13_01705 [Rhodocyclaceae bacterium]|nr:hypothetical protein [Rhodocyclaceae bacterium]